MKHVAIVIVALFLSGCASGIVDHSNDERHKEILGTCFATKKPAFLYEARCADLDAGGFGNSTFCTGIQGFDPEPFQGEYHTYQYKYPKSWEEYVNSRDSWDKTLFKKLLFEKQRSIIAPIEVGTKMKITGIYEYPRGETGHVLIVRAILTSGEFKNTEVELPSPGGFSDTGPNWASQWFYEANEGIKLSGEYLQRCGNQALNKRVN